MVTPEELKQLKQAVSEALNTARRLERQHQTYLKQVETNGRSRARTTSYNANAANLSSSLKADIDHIKYLAKNMFNF